MLQSILHASYIKTLKSLSRYWRTTCFDRHWSSSGAHDTTGELPTNTGLQAHHNTWAHRRGYIQNRSYEVQQFQRHFWGIRRYHRWSKHVVRR
jgi:hypothetical protein